MAPQWGMSFDPRPYLRELARGRRGARDLTRDQARELFSAIFAGEVAPAALGAILVALRVKGESVDELAGMMEALAAHVRPLRVPANRAITAVIPTYNGARKLPNLVPLLAMLIAREGVPVLVHGLAQEEHRVSTFEILARLGHAPVTTIGEAEVSLEDEALAAVPTGVLSPDLETLLRLRDTLGVRNTGHTLAKLMLPQGVSPTSACRLVSVTHPDFLELMRAHFAQSAGCAFVMRGVEGEPVARLREAQPIDEIKPDGSRTTHLLAQGDGDYTLPARDADATAEWTRRVVAGEIAPPVTLARQAALVVEHCRAQAASVRPPLRLVSSQ